MIVALMCVALAPSGPLRSCVAQRALRRTTDAAVCRVRGGALEASLTCLLFPPPRHPSQVVRNRIKLFAQKKVTLPAGRHKIVILDEADSMTGAAQQSMRRIMELYSSTTRFALACNTSTKIIEPIQSRCAILRFTRLSDMQLLKRINYVCDKVVDDSSDSSSD